MPCPHAFTRINALHAVRHTHSRFPCCRRSSSRSAWQWQAEHPSCPRVPTAAPLQIPMSTESRSTESRVWPVKMRCISEVARIGRPPRQILRSWEEIIEWFELISNGDEIRCCCWRIFNILWVRFRVEKSYHCATDEHTVISNLGSNTENDHSWTKHNIAWSHFLLHRLCWHQGSHWLDHRKWSQFLYLASFWHAWMYATTQ